MTFLTAFLWGSGISLGFVVGLVVWAIIRNRFVSVDSTTFKLLHAEANELLKERNELTGEMIDMLDRIAVALERDTQ